jgi:hypothetical protein
VRLRQSNVLPDQYWILERTFGGIIPRSTSASFHAFRHPLPFDFLRYCFELPYDDGIKPFLFSSSDLHSLDTLLVLIEIPICPVLKLLVRLIEDREI